ncbi:uncharacterized protein HMPREF1541_02242 [Cyphellophora europaea CBS 101466]|uniref:Uncharacterized protein n=1 Tax=Cyphellophora europaea (strain CBS 101466) TaxID=1220924 RepID=W2S556_CYPE1|nr:uncharacterized protein HMPREF1541_02242 [Cyphellophora europaea CBS 101466]ETN43084.1 hypothetical protein HMPREF1541_02242 [Cyphellophora europaea CBS 101466]
MELTFTKIKRSTSYPTIDSSRPELSVKAKTVYVTGAAPGSIGAGIAAAFAKAGAAKIGLFDRSEQHLQQTKESLLETHRELIVFTHTLDIAEAPSVGIASHWARVEIGAWDVFVNCAADYSPTPSTIQGSDEDDWWKSFETTVRSVQHFSKSFMPKARPNATYISLNAGTGVGPAQLYPKVSAYSAAKLAAAKLDDYLSVENPRLRVFTLNPGLVDTPLFRAQQQDPETRENVPLHDISLPADTCVWLASGESEFLRGRFVFASYDVDELLQRKAEIEADPFSLRLCLGGTR